MILVRGRSLSTVLYAANIEIKELGELRLKTKDSSFLLALRQGVRPVDRTQSLNIFEKTFVKSPPPGEPLRRVTYFLIRRGAFISSRQWQQPPYSYEFWIPLKIFALSSPWKYTNLCP